MMEFMDIFIAIVAILAIGWGLITIGNAVSRRISTIEEIEEELEALPEEPEPDIEPLVYGPEVMDFHGDHHMPLADNPLEVRGDRGTFVCSCGSQMVRVRVGPRWNRV